LIDKYAIDSVLPRSPARKRGMKGETSFYRCVGMKPRKFKIDGKNVVEILATGNQTVIPPTPHKDTGKPYEWITAGGFEDINAADLPMLASDIGELVAAALAPFGYAPEQPERQAASAGDDDSPHRELNNAALANLPAWVPALGLQRCRRKRGGYEAVATWRASSTGRPTEQRKYNLSIIPAGIRDFGDGKTYSALDLVMAARGCELDAAFGWLSEQLGFAREHIEVNGKANDEQEQHCATGALLISKREFLGSFIPPDYPIDGILQRRFVYSLTGKTGHGKTSIALLIARLVASQKTEKLGNHDVEQGNVVYFVGENPDDVRMREIAADALCLYGCPDPLDDRISYMPGVFDVDAMLERIKQEVARKLETASLVIVDTSAAYLLGDDENSNPQMGAHARTTADRDTARRPDGADSLPSYQACG
jgi:hypothetical protein